MPASISQERKLGRPARSQAGPEKIFGTKNPKSSKKNGVKMAKSGPLWLKEPPEQNLPHLLRVGGEGNEMLRHEALRPQPLLRMVLQQPLLGRLRVGHRLLSKMSARRRSGQRFRWSQGRKILGCCWREWTRKSSRQKEAKEPPNHAGKKACDPDETCSVSFKIEGSAQRVTDHILLWVSNECREMLCHTPADPAQTAIDDTWTCVVNVLEATMKSVRSGSTLARAWARWVPSMLDTKCTLMLP